MPPLYERHTLLRRYAASDFTTISAADVFLLLLLIFAYAFRH